MLRVLLYKLKIKLHYYLFSLGGRGADESANFRPLTCRKRNSQTETLKKNVTIKDEKCTQCKYDTCI